MGEGRRGAGIADACPRAAVRLVLYVQAFTIHHAAGALRLTAGEPLPCASHAALCSPATRLGMSSLLALPNASGATLGFNPKPQLTRMQARLLFQPAAALPAPPILHAALAPFCARLPQGFRV